MSEEEHTEINKFLKYLESISEAVSEHDISERIKNFAKEKFGQDIPDILIWEQMAFDFTENILMKNRDGALILDLYLFYLTKKIKWLNIPAFKG